MSAYEEMTQITRDQENGYVSNDNNDDNNDYNNDCGNNYNNDYDNNYNNKFTKNKFQYFPSNSLARNIVHAETNSMYNFKPGSFESLRLYNVILATNVDKNDSLYYNSPEEYAQSRNIEVNKQDIDSWHSQKERLFPGGNFNKEVYETIRKEKMVNRVKDQEIRREKANKEAENFDRLNPRIKGNQTKTKKPKKTTKMSI